MIPGLETRAASPGSPRTATASLLYWLLLICGLAGVTAARIDAPGDVLPLWVGSIAGVGLGQLLAWARVRLWVIGAVTMGAIWLAPVLLMMVLCIFGSVAGEPGTFALAFLPAAACGYLAQSERGGLIAFWYPAVLWMVAILDRPGKGTLDAHAALPLVVGLAALFVAFLRARETRRAAIWHACGNVRLAELLPRKVLRTSPLRAAAQHAWTGLVGAAALVLAAWVAPHLWQKDEAKTPNATTQAGTYGDLGEAPCCPGDDKGGAKNERVREYFPLLHGRDEEGRPAANVPCVPCRGGQRAKAGVVTTDDDNGGYTYTYTGAYGGGGPYGETAYGVTQYGGGYGNGYGGGYGGDNDVAGVTTPSFVPSYDTTPTYQPYVPPPVAPAPVLPATNPTPIPIPAPPVAALETAEPEPVVTPPPPHVAPVQPATTPAKPAVVLLVPQPAASAFDGGAPWRSALFLCLGGFAAHLLLRAVRRGLTLRHLTRPFWPESVDQRISNHWQRMLIGLGDAGIHPAGDEQPQALARRVGIDGMTTCATILERVRHGVRIEPADLEAMNAAADAVYRAARAKAGISGRAAGWVRSPL